MSSYTFKNFQLFIFYIFQFDHVVLKRLPIALNLINDFFRKLGQKQPNFFSVEYSLPVEYSRTLKSFFQIQNKLIYLRFFFQINRTKIDKNRDN